MRHTVFLGTALALIGFQPTGMRSAESATVDIRTFQFAPDTLRVRPGAKVVWTNRDEIEHTVTAGSPDGRSASFDKSLGGKGASYEVVFDRPGTFHYFCDRHQFMRGVIIVTH